MWLRHPTNDEGANWKSEGTLSLKDRDTEVPPTFCQRLYHRTKTSDDFLQPVGDLTEGANFDRFEQRGEAVVTALDYVGELGQGAFRFLRVFLFELREPIDLKLLFGARRAREFHLGRVVFVAIFVQRNDRTSAVVNLLLVTMRGALDLTALITILDRGQDSAHPLDLAKFLQDRCFNRALDRFHSGRATQHVHGVFKNAGLLE